MKKKKELEYISFNKYLIQNIINIWKNIHIKKSKFDFLSKHIKHSFFSYDIKKNQYIFIILKKIDIQISMFFENSHYISEK